MIPYNIEISTTRNLPNFYTANKGVTYNGQNGNNDLNCSIGEKAYFRINIKEEDILKTGAGEYKSILTIIVSPT